MDVIGGLVFADGIALYPRPDVVPGVPLVLHGSEYPGGKILNGAAFTAPPTGQQGDFRRNVLRGFGAAQADVAFQRQFHFTERLGLRFRGEFFKYFNHPTLALPTTTSPMLSSATRQRLWPAASAPGEPTVVSIRSTRSAARADRAGPEASILRATGKAA